MTTTTHACEIFLMVGDDGNYVVASSKSDLPDRWDSEIGEELPLGHRIIRAVFSVEIPAPVTLSVDIPASEGAVSLKVEG